MDTTLVIGLVVGAVLLIVIVWALIALSRAKAAPKEDPGRGPTGQTADPIEGTPSETSTPHWDRRPEGREGPL